MAEVSKAAASQGSSTDTSSKSCAASSERVGEVGLNFLRFWRGTVLLSASDDASSSIKSERSALPSYGRRGEVAKALEGAPGRVDPAPSLRTAESGEDEVDATGEAGRAAKASAMLVWRYEAGRLDRPAVLGLLTEAELGGVARLVRSWSGLAGACLPVMLGTARASVLVGCDGSIQTSAE